jgi:DNA mismatch repair protein MutS
VAVAEWRGDIVFLRQIVDGPASRSYGLEVAKLAGVPEPVVRRARELLAALEAGEASRVSDGGAAAQLPLFASPEQRLVQELAGLEPDRMTPLDALAVLARLAEAARLAR